MASTEIQLEKFVLPSLGPARPTQVRDNFTTKVNTVRKDFTSELGPRGLRIGPPITRAGAGPNELETILQHKLTQLERVLLPSPGPGGLMITSPDLGPGLTQTS